MTCRLMPDQASWSVDRPSLDKQREQPVEQHAGHPATPIRSKQIPKDQL